MDYGKRVAGKNDVLLKEIVLLCHLLALLLGPKSWAEYREPYQRVSTAKALQFVHTMKDNLYDICHGHIHSLGAIEGKHLVEQCITLSEATSPG